MKRPLILASASPRRKELLAAAGLDFEIIPSDQDESILPGEDPLAYVRRIALSKAKNVTLDHADHLVLAADTVVVLDRTIMGKPSDAGDAFAMLQRLSGRTHQVITAYCFAAAFIPEPILEHVLTDVSFRLLSSRDINSYIASGEPFDKAGAYAIQGKGGALTSRVEGSYTNVVGLPLAEVLKRLEDLGRTM